MGDCWSLPLDAESVDLVITSPPHCARIDYAVKTKFELAVMGVGSKVRFAKLPVNGNDLHKAPKACRYIP
jgi:hypothetical protein